MSCIALYRAAATSTTCRISTSTATACRVFACRVTATASEAIFRATARQLGIRLTGQLVLCAGCSMAKGIRAAMPRSRAAFLGELVHINLAEPYETSIRHPRDSHIVCPLLSLEVVTPESNSIHSTLSSNARKYVKGYKNRLTSGS